MNRRRLVGAALAALTPPAIIIPRVQAQGDFVLPYNQGLVDECGEFWPGSGTFGLERVGDEYTATLWFSLSKARKQAIECVGEGADLELELDFRFNGFATPPEWSGYWGDTDLRGYTLGPFMDDGSTVAMPRLSGMAVDQIRTNREYYAWVAFSDLELNGDGPPRVSFEWVLKLRGVEIARSSLSDGHAKRMLVFDEDYYFEF